MKDKISTMLRCTSLVSVSVVLGKIFIFRLPFGGSINLSPVPIIVSSFMFGPAWGAYSGFLYSILKIILGFQMPPVTSFWGVVLVIFLDYVVPYVSLGLSSEFNFFETNSKTYFGIISAMAIRLLSNTISGIVIWKNLLYPSLDLFSYSLIYNLIYIFPETVLSIVLCPMALRFFKHKV